MEPTEHTGRILRNASPSRTWKSEADIDTHVMRCLSLILHNEEVQEIAEVIKRILRDNLNSEKSVG